MRLGCLAVSLIACASFSDKIRLRVWGLRWIFVIKLVEVVAVFLFLLCLLCFEADWSLRCLKIDWKLVRIVEFQRMLNLFSLWLLANDDLWQRSVNVFDLRRLSDCVGMIFGGVLSLGLGWDLQGASV